MSAPVELPTPLLDALYRTYNVNREPVLDTQDMNDIMDTTKTVGFGNIKTMMPPDRQDATAMKRENERFHRLSMAWNAGHGEPKRRKAKKHFTRKSKSRKPKWIPRKKYLAKKRKAKLHGKRK